MFCSGSSIAKKKYQSDVIRIMVCYLVVVVGSALVVKHGHMRPFFVYFWSVLPAIPIIGVIARMAAYLRTETDEYQKLLVMQALLVGTAVLLGALMVNDFLRAYADAGALPPFAAFILFCFGMGGTQVVQKLKNRTADDE